jgi:hypothetical protein
VPLQRMADMSAPRSSIVHQPVTQPASRRQTRTSEAGKAAVEKPVNRSASDTEKRKAAALLLEIKTDGEVLSARIERLRHRFL